jgi:protein-disulfide isomerase
MLLFKRLLIVLVLAAPALAQADEGFYPIVADDGTVIANHREPVEIESEIEKLPGVVIAGNPRGSVTLAEFYDVNCPFCRAASGDIDTLLKRNRELRLVLVPFPVLGIASIQGTRVELAVARLASADNFYRFHRILDSGRGTVDGARALAAAKAIGLDSAKVLSAANEDVLAEVMKAHVRLGDALGIQATPGFIVKGVAINGYPGPKALAKLIDEVDRCGAVICEAPAQ